MRVLYDTRVLNTPYPSGVGHYAKSLLTALLDNNTKHNLSLFVNSFHPPSDYFSSLLQQTATKPNFDRIVSTRYPNKLLSFSWSLSSFPKLKNKLEDIDLFHSPHINAFNSAAIPRLTTIHDLSFTRFPQFLSPQSRLWHRMMSITAQKSDFFIADTYSTKQDLIKIWRIPSEKIKVIYPGVDDLSSRLFTDYEALAAKFKLTKPYFLFLGTLEPRKNLSRLLTAFKGLISQPAYRNFQLVLGGQPGYLSTQLITKIHRLNLDASVILTNYLSLEDKISLLRNAFAFVYPSLYEGFGLPLLEAMQFGIPVLSSDISSIPEVTGDSAILIDPHDTDQLLQGLIKLSEDKTLRENLSRKAQKRYQLFSWEKCAREILEYYEQIA